jgi:hypothetical protein
MPAKGGNIMSIPEISIVIGGALSSLLVIFHCLFYRVFGWDDEFKGISKASRKILYTIHLALLLFLLISALLSLLFFRELAMARGLAAAIITLLALFWLWRGLWQIIYFRPGNEDVGGKLAVIHYLLIAIFIALFACYAVPLIMAIKRVPGIVLL